MNKAPGAAAGSYRTGHTGKAFIRGIMLLVLLLVLLLGLLPRAESADWVPVTGKVMFGDTPLCAMVLANGQNMFSCSGDGSFNLSVPLDKNGQVTLFTFAQGFAPYRQTLSPAQVANTIVNMGREPESRTLSVNYSTSDAQRSGWVVVKGSIDFSGTPVCALMLANGQHMFSCNENLGRFTLEVPSDNSGNVTLFAFVSGFQPFKVVYSSQGNGASGSITVNSSTIVLSDTQTSQIASTTENADGTTQLVTTANSTLGTALEVDSVVLVTGGTDSRFPLGFAGKVISVTAGNNGTTSVALTNATIAEVAQKSSFQSNEVALNSTNFIGVISPNAVKASATAQPQSLGLLDHGITALNGGLVLSEPNVLGRTVNGVLSSLGILDDGLDVSVGEISLNLEVKLDDLDLDLKKNKPYGSGIEASFNINGSVKNLRLIENHDFDTIAGVIPVLKSIDARVTGDVSFDVALNGGVEANIGYFSQAWNEVENEAIELLGVSAKLTGLDSKDKIGKFPLAGLVFATKCPPPSGCPITTGNTQTPLRAAKGGGVIVWFYFIADGEIRLDGEAGARLSAGHISVGFQKMENKGVDGVREFSNTGTERFIEAPYFDGDVAVVSSLGFGFDVDFFTLGVRLGNGAAFVGVTGNAAMETNSPISYGTTGLGDPWTWSHNDEVCGHAGFSTGAKFSASFDLGYEIDTPLGKTDGGTSYLGTWPTDEEALDQGWHAALYTWLDWRFCLPAPVVNKVITTQDVPTQSLTITVDGAHLPVDLQLNVFPTASCTGIQNNYVSDTSVNYTCQLADEVTTLAIDLISEKADNIDLSSVSDQLSIRLGPFPPTNVATSAGDKQVTISWDSVLNATSYTLYWGTIQPVTKANGTKIADISNTSYVHSELTNGTNYYYTVTAVNDMGESEESDNGGLVATPRTILNDRILMLSEREGNWEVYSVGLDGKTDPTNLTENPAEDRMPSLSPERGRIAFVSDRDGNNEIYVMTSDGANPTRLTSHDADDITPIWSPDGKEIAFVSERNGNYEIYVMDANGKNLLRLTNSSADDTFPSWSPDSKRIIFVSERDGNEEIYIIDANGTGVAENITNNRATDTIPFFSPDGAWISFVSDRDGSYDLWVMDTNGNNLRKITTATNNEVGWYAWSPDGTQIAFDSRADGDYEVYIYDFHGETTSPVTINSDADQFASWTWDGKKIVFISDRDGTNQIYAMDPNGDNPVNISNDTSNVALPMVSPVYQTGGGCFIATAAYGSYLEPEVMVLRELRDKYLLTNDAGKAFVRHYYKWSPPVADVIAEHKSLRIFVRISMTPLVYSVKYPTGSSVLFMLMMFAYIYYSRIRKKGNATKENTITFE